MSAEDQISGFSNEALEKLLSELDEAIAKKPHIPTERELRGLTIDIGRRLNISNLDRSHDSGSVADVASQPEAPSRTEQTVNAAQPRSESGLQPSSATQKSSPTSIRSGEHSGLPRSKSIASPTPYIRPKSVFGDSCELSDEDLIQILRQSALTTVAGLKHRPYAKVRDECFSAGLELNKRRRIAPVFRPGRVPMFNPPVHLKGEMELLSRDRQLIDLDWISSSGIPIRPDDAKFSRMFAGGCIDQDLANEFVCKAWRHEVKAERILALPDLLQIQLSTLRSKAIRDRHRNASTAANRDTRRILLAASLNRRLLAGEVECLVELDTAQRLAAGLPSAAISEIYALMSGRPALSTTERKRLMRKLRRFVD